MAYCLLSCVVSMGNASKVIKCAKKYGVKSVAVSIGQGTRNNPVLDVLAINRSRKEIVTMVVENGLASNALKGIGKDMEFEKQNHGIAFFYPISEYIGGGNVIGKGSEAVERREVMYNIIHVIVDKGKAEDVIEAANKAGAKGGTILNARGAGVPEVQKFFSIVIDPEKEDVFIITESGLKDSIVSSIRSSLNIDEPGNGIIMVVDVAEVYGLQ